MIRIEIPDDGSIQTTNGIKVFTGDGHEIKEVSRIEIDILPNEVLLAKITVPIAGANFDRLLASLGDRTLMDIAEEQGYELVKK